MVNLWLTSDSHFSHDAIIGYAKRPFTSAAEMDEALVENWNRVVKPSDHVYHLGDVVMKRSALAVVKRLNGHLRLVRGNHDIFRTKEYLAVGFEEIYGCRVIDGFLMTHIPVHEQSLGRFKANLHGHTHEQFVCGSRYINLCVEQTAYTPVHFEDVKKLLTTH